MHASACIGLSQLCFEISLLLLLSSVQHSGVHAHDSARADCFIRVYLDLLVGVL